MAVGRLLKVMRGEEHYGIAKHDDLTPYLGKHWFIRGINTHLDFCAVLANTVIFHLHKKAQIVDHLNGESIDGGYVLIFKFVRLILTESRINCLTLILTFNCLDIIQLMYDVLYFCTLYCHDYKN